MKESKGISIALTFVALIIIAIIAIPVFIEFKGNYSMNEQREYIKQQIELCTKERDSILSKYNEKNQILISNARYQIDLILNSYLHKGYIGINSITKEIKSFKTMGYICYLQSYDIIKKTNNTDLFLAEIFNRNIGNVTLETHKKCEMLLTELEVKLRENNTNLQIELGTLLEKYKGIPVSLDLKNLNFLTNQFIGDGKKIGALYGGVAVGLIFESIYIKSTIMMIKKLTQRVALKMTASTALAIADGPIPIGDIVAIIGWGWCAYDIYELKKSVPNKIKKDLTTNLEKDHTKLSNYMNQVINALETNTRIKFN